MMLDVPPSPGRHAWRQEVADRAAFHGWRCHALGADWSPDLLIVRRPRLIWIFCEPNRGRLSEARLDAFAELRSCRQAAVVVRPSNVVKLERMLA